MLKFQRWCGNTRTVVGLKRKNTLTALSQDRMLQGPRELRKFAVSTSVSLGLGNGDSGAGCAGSSCDSWRQQAAVPWQGAAISIWICDCHRCCSNGAQHTSSKRQKHMNLLVSSAIAGPLGSNSSSCRRRNCSGSGTLCVSSGRGINIYLCACGCLCIVLLLAGIAQPGSCRPPEQPAGCAHQCSW